MWLDLVSISAGWQSDSMQISSRHMTSNNVVSTSHATSWRRIDIDMTLFSSYVLEGRLRFSLPVFSFFFTIFSNKIWYLETYVSMHKLWYSSNMKEQNQNNIRKAAKIRNRYNQVPHLTQDTTWESKHNKTLQIRAKRSVLSQKVTTRQQWTDAKAWQTQDINNTNDPQKKYRLGTVGKNILLEGLNRFHGANLTLTPSLTYPISNRAKVCTLVWVFIYIHTLCFLAAKSLAILSLEPSDKTDLDFANKSTEDKTDIQANI